MRGLPLPLFFFRGRCDHARSRKAARRLVVDGVIVIVFIALFFIGCAWIGWTIGTAGSGWIVLFLVSLAAIVLLDRRR